ncbi:hypothetical protein [Mesorhizobium xinjiangense]|uniref:hypothetical protein n=1 Tax=Mesorhizobium xinjiangense TaxID=2678685 RepID=UPI0012ECDE0B|nr:hypothetical protein [Mesorhizobium xinjiangense]
MKRVINFWSLLSFISVSVFVAIEIIVIAAAMVWSVSGLLHFGTYATTSLGILIAIPALFAIIKVTILAFQAETNPENN